MEKLAQGWVVAGIKIDLESQKDRMNRYKEEGRQSAYLQQKGIVKGLEMALKNIEKAYSN